MTSRERITKVLQHNQTDRTPIFEYVFTRNVPEALLNRKFYNFDSDSDEWCEYAKEIGFEKALKQYVCDRLDICEILGHDMLYVIYNPIMSYKYNKYPNEQKYDEDDPVEILQARNERRNYEIENNLPVEDSFLVYDLLNEEIEKRGIELDVFAPTYSHGASTDTILLSSMLMDENAVKEHYRLQTVYAKQLIYGLTKRGIRHIGVGGDFSGNRPIISPECYCKYIVPEVAKCTEYVHSKGAWAVNASDGDLWSVIKNFLIDTGVDAYMEIDARAGMDLKRLKDSFGDRITFYGNIDCGEVLSTYSEDEIAKLTVKCLEDGMGNGGHIFTASNAITQTVPVNNYMAMVNAYRNYFGLNTIKLKS